MVQVPSKLSSNIIDVHGKQGSAWLDQLPGLISSVEEKWRIQVGHPLDQLTYHFVAPANLQDGNEAILKLGVPGSHFVHEVECLQQYAGRGAAEILQHDLSLAAMLLERVKPGSNIKSLDEDSAVRATAHVMSRLHQASKPSAKLPAVCDWGEAFQRLRDTYDGQTGPLPREIVDEAERVFFELAASMSETVLVHGDLHHENILSSHRAQWLAIDPQGVVGEPCYEIGAFLRNPIPDVLDWSNLEGITRSRVAMFCELTGFESKRIYGWGFSQAVLSAIWWIEDHGSGWEKGIHIAEIIRSASA